MNRSWQKFDEMQHKWVARQKELVDEVDQLAERAARAEKTLSEA